MFLGVAMVAVGSGAGCLHRAPRDPYAPREFERPLRVNGSVLTVHLACPLFPTGRPLLLYATGDGGWRGKDLDAYRQIVSWGYPMAGFSAPEYLEHLEGGSDTTTAAGLADSYGAIIALAKRALPLPAETPTVLVGISRGAGLAVLAAGQVRLRHELGGVVAVGLTKEEEYVLDFSEIRIGPVGPLLEAQVAAPYDRLPQLGTLPVSVIQATHDDYLPARDARSLFGPDTATRQFLAIESSNHSFTDAREPMYEALQASLRWIEGKLSAMNLLQ